MSSDLERPAMITHGEIIFGLYLLAVAGSGTFGLIAGKLRPSRKRLDDEFDSGKLTGYDLGWQRGYDHGVEDCRRGVEYVYDEDGSEVMPDAPAAGPGRYPDGRRVGFTYGMGTGYEDDDRAEAEARVSEARAAHDQLSREAGRTIYPELAALAEPGPDGPERHADGTGPLPVRLDETSEQWAARMDMEAAIWCAENGIDRELVAT